MRRKITCMILSVLILVAGMSLTAQGTENVPLSIQVTPGFLRLHIGDTAQLFPTVLPVEADRTLFYQSENPKVASVSDSGSVTAVGLGQTEITVFCLSGGRKDTVSVLVEETDSMDAPSLSPWNMATNTSIFATDGYDKNTVTSGGNFQYATTYMSRWDGPVWETDDPYPYGDTMSTLSPMDRYIEADAAFHVQGVDWLPERTAWDDNDHIKEAIARYSAVYGSFDAANDCWSKGKTAYYMPQSFQGATSSHAVAIVGWDDAYPKENFAYTPAGDGAFICRNSYGESTGEKGYIYISYYDKTFAKKSCPMAITNVESNENYDTQYLYDTYGAIGLWSPFKLQSLYCANIFPASGQTLASDQMLEAVSIYVPVENTSYELHIASEYDWLDDLPYETPVMSGTFRYTGYQTLRLPEPVALSAGTRFAVVFKLSVPNDRAKIYVEYPYSYVDPTTGTDYPLCISATAGFDEGYVSADQMGWYDVAEYVGNGNLCIRAFTTGGEEKQQMSLCEETMETEQEPITYLTEQESLSMNIEPHPALREQQEPSLSLLSDTAKSGMLFPTRYDMRTENILSPMRNQGSWNTCWAHTSCAMVESFLMRAKMRSDYALDAEQLSYEAIVTNLETAHVAEQITFQKAEMTVEVGETAMLYADITPRSAEETHVLFESSSDCVRVDSYGNVTGVKPGTARITCRVQNSTVQNTCTVTVMEDQEAERVILAENVLFLAPGDVHYTEYAIAPAGTGTELVTRKSSDETVCIVDDYGRIKAIAPGTAKITVSAENGVSDSITVCVSDGKDGQIYCAEDDKGVMLVTAENRTNETVELFLAFYTEKGALCGVARQPIEKGFAGTVEVEIPVAENVAYGKGMLWHQLKPVAKPLYMEKKKR